MDDSIDAKIERRLKPKDGSPDLLADRVAEFRSMFQREFEQNRDLYDQRDFDRFMDTEDDWYARRWVIYQRDINVAFELLKDAMRWRKDINLNGLSYEDFPREFYECGCVFEYGQDLQGRRIIYIRCSLVKPMSEINALNDKFFAFMVDQCDKRSKSKGFTMLYDVTGAGFSNVEMSTIKNMINLRDRFPLSSRSILIVGLPWILMPVFKVVMSLIPPAHAAAFKVINQVDLTQFVDSSQIPSPMGGTSKIKFQVVPAQSKYSAEFPDLSKSTATKLKKHVDSKIDRNDIEVVNSMRVLR